MSERAETAIMAATVAGFFGGLWGLWTLCWALGGAA